MIGEELSTEGEDAFAVAIKKSWITVGHIPREISKTFWHFITHDGDKISGRRQRSILLEEGLEVPCVYTLKGKKKLVDKLTTILQEMKFKLLS